jgi:hypothetical protein
MIIILGGYTLYLTRYTFGDTFLASQTAGPLQRLLTPKIGYFL